MLMGPETNQLKYMTNYTSKKPLQNKRTYEHTHTHSHIVCAIFVYLAKFTKERFCS